MLSSPPHVQKCIMTSQRLLIDVRALAPTACVNNLHSSAIKGERGSLNHSGPHAGDAHASTGRQYKRVHTYNTHAFSVTFVFSLSSLFGYFGFFKKKKVGDEMTFEKQTWRGGKTLNDEKLQRAEVVLARPNQISIIKRRHG